MNYQNIYNPSANIIQRREVDYKLNMEILASLKPLPGKIINLDSNNIFSNTTGELKKDQKETKYTNNTNISNKLTTSSCQIKEESPKKSFTESSVFRPIPLKKTNYFTNPSFHFNSLINVSSPNYFANNFINYPKPFLWPNSYLNMNSVSNIKELNLLKDSMEFYLFLQKKRNLNFAEERESNIETIENKKNQLSQSTTQINETSKKIDEITNAPKVMKKLFNVIPKSSYVYRKRKPRRKKVFHKTKEIICEHEGCEGKFKTKKQAVFHHYKMSIECHNDTINLLKMISEIKKILLKDEEKKENIFCKYSSLYEETMKKVSLNEHIDTITGFDFRDIISDN